MTAVQIDRDRTSEGLFGRWPLLLWSTVGFLLLLGLGLRLLDVDEPPLDFHPDRQLQSALIARGLYYRWLPGADPETRSQAGTLGAGWGCSWPPRRPRRSAGRPSAAGNGRFSPGCWPGWLCSRRDARRRSWRAC